MKSGVFAAMLTPLKPDGAIDDSGLRRLAFWLLANGCNGLVLFGTTGEFRRSRWMSGMPRSTG